MLTDKTYSLAADVGMYFACVFMTTFLHLQWTLPLGSKNFVDYGQPVLAGFRGEMMLNPVRVATMVAWGAARKTAKPSQLRNTYEVWASYIDGSP
jgi:hypothetical protein